MTVVGAIDIGTNSTRLLIAEVTGGELRELERRSVVTRLGEGVDAQRRLLEAPIARVQAVLDEFRVLLDRAGARSVLAVATSAVRDSANGGEFLAAIADRYRVETRLLSGDEEARLTRRGVGAVEPTTLILDVGGGSTELTLAEFRTSLDVGSVRLTERFLHSDPPEERELSEAAAFVAGLLPKLEVSTAIGVAGTVTQLHELFGQLTRSVIEAGLAELAGLALSERALLPAMDPARAPVIVGGTIIVAEVVRRYRLDELLWSRRDLLDGVALEAAEPGR
jgi:exopolyphosphatase/guanosine-5'-triphosphate,3'-diphosphate pyrophosphatase